MSDCEWNITLKSVKGSLKVSAWKPEDWIDWMGVISIAVGLHSLKTGVAKGHWS